MALFDDDGELSKPKRQPKPLDGMGIVELEDYVAALREEISRVQAVMAAKKAHRAGVEGLFRIPEAEG